MPRHVPVRLDGIGATVTFLLHDLHSIVVVVVVAVVVVVVIISVTFCSQVSHK